MIAIDCDGHVEADSEVKPENILVSCERAILCDFGVAELLTESMYHRHARIVGHHWARVGTFAHHRLAAVPICTWFLCFSSEVHRLMLVHAADL